MGYCIKGTDRHQLALFNDYIDDRVAPNSEVRIIDSFVKLLDNLNFSSDINNKGTNYYDPRSLLALYLYGYRHAIRSSRKLEEQCYINIEVIWLMRDLKPNFRTIAEFRKKNAAIIKEAFKKLVITCSENDLVSGNFSQDGTKVAAVNSKERNYTASKLDDKIKNLEEKISEYLKQLDETDEKDKSQTLRQLEMHEMQKRLDNYNELLKEIEEKNISQISETDRDSKLMKNNGKFEVCYNVQKLEDAESHLTIGFSVGNNPADVGSMEEITRFAKELLGLEDEIITNTTDKGYYDSQDMIKCLENGVIPEVTPQEGAKEFKLEIEYEEESANEIDLKSTKSEDIKKALRNGKIPECYKEYITEISVEEKVISEEVSEEEISEEMSNEDLRDLAMREKIFVKNVKEGKVFCPMGEILRKKSKNGKKIKYCNKLACERCKNPCTRSRFKEVVMGEKQVIVSRDNKLKKKYNPKIKRKRKKVKVVKIIFRPNQERLKMRMGVSEHPHGTMKVTDHFTRFLLKGQENVETELALHCIGSNLRRLKNMLGFEGVMELFSKQRVEKA